MSSLVRVVPSPPNGKAVRLGSGELLSMKTVAERMIEYGVKQAGVEFISIEGSRALHYADYRRSWHNGQSVYLIDARGDGGNGGTIAVLKLIREAEIRHIVLWQHSPPDGAPTMDQVMFFSEADAVLGAGLFYC